MNLARRLTRLETRHTGGQAAHGGHIVIYDDATGLPLPGYEPHPDVRVSIWLPAKERAPDPYDDLYEDERDAGGSWR